MSNTITTSHIAGALPVHPITSLPYLEMQERYHTIIQPYAVCTVHACVVKCKWHIAHIYNNSTLPPLIQVVQQ